MVPGVRRRRHRPPPRPMERGPVARPVPVLQGDGPGADVTTYSDPPGPRWSDVIAAPGTYPRPDGGRDLDTDREWRLAWETFAGERAAQHLAEDLEALE
jgi:hypothetical protein